MARYRLTLEYDGTPFVGWQFQDNGLSVQAVLEDALASYGVEVLREARAQANDIIAKAEARAAQIIDQAKHDAIAEGGRQIALAQAEIDANLFRAREDLRKQVSALAVSGAEKLLKREIDANAHKALLDELAAEI